MSKTIPGIVTPTRKMTAEQIAEQLHFRRRATRVPSRNRDSARGGRNCARRAAIDFGR